jgi:Domain of unknown function (DUF4190)
MAIWSLVTGIVGIVCCFGILGPVSLFLGMSSRRRIEESGGALSGGGLATAGAILGGVGTLELLGCIVAIVIVLITNHG